MIHAPLSIADVLDLAVRCEAATGPDRELDGLIHAALNPEMTIVVDHEPGRFPQKAIFGVPGDLIRSGFDLVALADYISAPPYTASIDAAMGLYVRVPDRIPSDPRKVAAEALRQRAGDA